MAEERKDRLPSVKIRMVAEILRDAISCITDENDENYYGEKCEIVDASPTNAGLCNHTTYISVRIYNKREIRMKLKSDGYEIISDVVLKGINKSINTFKKKTAAEYKDFISYVNAAVAIIERMNDEVGVIVGFEFLSKKKPEEVTVFSSGKLENGENKYVINVE